MLIEGEPWFVAADVCRALGLSLRKGAGNNLRHLDADQKRTITRRGSPDSPILSGGVVGLFEPRVPHLVFISEGGAYRLTFRSDLPEALPFRRWVENEVLPAIRKTGGYLLNEEARKTAAVDQRDAMPIPQTYPDALRAFAEALEKRIPAGRLAPKWQRQEAGKKRWFSASFRWRDARPPIGPHP